MGPSFKVFLLKKVLTSPVNNARDSQFFNKMQEHTFFVRSKCTLRMLDDNI